MYTLISKPLADNGLKPPVLNALIADGELYSTLLLQHQGDIEASNTGEDRYVRNLNQALAHQQFTAFFEVARQEEADLVVTPEYSCPWSVIDEIITDNNMPESGKVWLVGCESIRPNELRDFRHKHENAIVLIADEKIESTITDKFLDPVCILFRTKTLDGAEEKDVLLIQFKTKSMAGVFEIETLIRGENRYVLHNEGDDDIRLAVVICSDASDLMLNSTTFPNFNTYPYFLAHLQLNPKSKQTNFKNYRTSYFSTGKEHLCDKELLCLNWANGSRLPKGNGAFDRLESGGTSIYVKWHELNNDDDRVNLNDSKGLFYNYWPNGYTSIFSFVPLHGIYLFNSFKCSQKRAGGADAPRSGPQMGSVFSWSNNSWEVLETSEIDLRLKIEGLLGGDFDEDILETFFDKSIPYLDLERFVLLTNGAITPQNKGGKRWTYAQNLQSLHVKTEEYSRRFTYLFDSDEDSSEWKRRNYFNFVKIGNILKNNPGQIFTDGRFSDFAAGCSLKFTSSNLNILSSTDRKATLSYFEQLNDSTAKLKHETITTAISEEIGDSSNVVVVYNTVQNEIKAEFPSDAKIDENLRKGSASILRAR